MRLSSRCCLFCGAKQAKSSPVRRLCTLNERNLGFRAAKLDYFNGAERGGGVNFSRSAQCCYERYYPLKNTRTYVRIAHAKEYGQKYVKERTVVVIQTISSSVLSSADEVADSAHTTPCPPSLGRRPMVGAAAVEATAPIEFDRVLIVLSSFASRPPSIFFLSRGTTAQRRTEDREMKGDGGLAAFLLFGHERWTFRIPRRSVFERMANFEMKEH